MLLGHLMTHKQLSYEMKNRNDRCVKFDFRELLRAFEDYVELTEAFDED